MIVLFTCCIFAVLMLRGGLAIADMGKNWKALADIAEPAFGITAAVL